MTRGMVADAVVSKVYFLQLIMQRWFDHLLLFFDYARSNGDWMPVGE